MAHKSRIAQFEIEYYELTRKYEMGDLSELMLFHDLAVLSQKYFNEGYAEIAALRADFFRISQMSEMAEMSAPPV